MAAATHLLLLQTNTNRVSPFSSLIIYPTTNSNNAEPNTRHQTLLCPSFSSSSSSSSLHFYSKVSLCVKHRNKHNHSVFSCLPPPTTSSSSSSFRSARNASTKLYVSGLSFRTTEESLTNAFKNFGQLIEVNLVMDKIANRPRGFAFLRYETEEESKIAIEGMHGKFLDGRVIFVEVAKPKWELRNGT